MKRKKNLRRRDEVVKCADGTELSLEDLRGQVQAAAAGDTRFTQKAQGNGIASPWVMDLVLSGGADWKAVIQAADGKFYEVTFEVTDGKVSLGDEADEVVRKTQYVAASTGDFYVDGKPTMAGDGMVTGKPTMDARVGKMRKAVSDAMAGDKRFTTGTGSSGQPARDWEKSYVVDVLVPDADGKHHAVVKRDDGKLVKHGFSFDEDKGTATLDDGESDTAEMNTVYSRLIEVHDEAVRATLPKETPAAVKVTVRPNETDVIHCRDVGAEIVDNKWSMDKPATFTWMPRGVHVVTASWAKKPIRMAVDVDKKTAEVVQASFENWKKTMPEQEPYGCVEHRAEEAFCHPRKFMWDDTSGVQCQALPTDLGVRNVNGRIHRSFSPTFTTDAEYSKCVCSDCKKQEEVCQCESPGVLLFPEGARGSATNPARVTGVAFTIGSLTNKPAFKKMPPVKTTEAETDEQLVHASAPNIDQIFDRLSKQATPPATNGNNQNKGTKMKVRIIKARGNYSAGKNLVEVSEEDGKALLDGGFAVSEVMAAQTDEIETLKTERKNGKVATIKAKIAEAKKRGAIPAADTAVEARCLERLDKIGDSADGYELIVELVDAAQPKQDNLNGRQTAPVGAGGRVEYGETSLREEGDAYIKAREPMSKLARSGEQGLKDCAKIAIESSKHMAKFVKAMRAGEDFLLKDVVTGADVTDPDSQLGTLATGLIVMRNLGFLKNKLGWLPYISTDMRSEPAKWKQPILTRYITPPNVLTFIPGIGYTSDATTIANQTAGETETTGTLTKSAPSSTDVTVTIDQHKAVEIEFHVQKLGSTMRNLFAEQQGAQFYSLAETVNAKFLSTVFGATWTGIVSSMQLGQFGLPGAVQIKNRMTLSKMPDTGRFALLHSYYHDGILTDSNLLSAKAILALINKDASSFDSGELPPLFGVKYLETQLASYVGATATPPTIGAGDGSVTFPGSALVGFAGNSASMCFVARTPQDYTTVLGNIPSTAAVEIVTEPDSGLSIMLVKYINHEKASVSARCALMYGFAQGDPRQGIVLKP